MATIADVARQAGVAPSTVSHALSGKRPVAAATRERIVAAARALGYEPNATAGNVRARRTRAVGLSLPHDSPGRTQSHGPFAKYAAAITDLLAAHGYTFLCLVARSPEASDLARLVRGGHLDGLILLQVRLDDPRVHASAGDSMLTELAQPPITAVDISVADQCRRTVKLRVGMMNRQRPARCGHLISVHLTARGSTGRLEPARGSQNQAARGEDGPHVWREKGGRQRTVPRSASGCHSLLPQHHR
jgi:DNA-binding LacI/PurR family transcriptional regulator